MNLAGEFVENDQRPPAQFSLKKFDAAGNLRGHSMIIRPARK